MKKAPSLAWFIVGGLIIGAALNAHRIKDFILNESTDTCKVYCTQKVDERIAKDSVIQSWKTNNPERYKWIRESTIAEATAYCHSQNNPK